MLQLDPSDPSTECPLLDQNKHKDLVDAFKLVVAVMESLDDEFARWVRDYFSHTTDAEQPPLNPNERLSRIREVLCRKRYRIGFAGRSQLGKSAAVNQLLGRKLLKEGGAQACTSVVTVIEVLPTLDEQRFHATYFTQPELMRRFESVAESTELTHSPVKRLPEDFSSVQNVIDQLEEWQRNRDQSHTQSTVEKKADSGEYLLAFARQALYGRHLLGTTASPIQCQSSNDLEQRLAKIVAYRPEEDPSGSGSDVKFALLVKQVTVGVHLDGFIPQVEVVDLPGLGTFRECDSQLTEEYVSSLDGLLLFVTPKSIDNIELKTLVNYLKKTHHELAGRVWLVVTQMDILDSEAREGPLFKALQDNVPKLEIRPEQVRFFSAYCELDGKKLVTREVKDRKHVATGLNLIYENGDIKLPDCLTMQGKPFQDAFKAYVQDGGYAELRRVIETEIAKTVRVAVCREAAKDLEKLIDDLLGCLDEAATGGLDDQNRDLAHPWSIVFLDIPERLAPGSPDLSGVGQGLFESFWQEINSSASTKTINSVRNANHQGDSNSHPWVVLHRAITNKMARTCKRILPELQTAYLEAVKKTLREEARTKAELAEKNGEPICPKNCDPLKELTDRLEKDRDHLTAAIQAELQQLQEPTAIRDPATGQIYRSVETDDYQTIMRRKVESLSYSILARLRRQMLGLCAQVQRHLNLLANGQKGPQNVNLDRLKGWVSELQKAQSLVKQFQERLEREGCEEA